MAGQWRGYRVPLTASTGRMGEKARTALEERWQRAIDNPARWREAQLSDAMRATRRDRADVLRCWGLDAAY